MKVPCLPGTSTPQRLESTMVRRRSGMSRAARRTFGTRRPLRVNPDFHRHLLLVCLAVIGSWVLPGSWVQLSGFGFLYLTGLLGLRLGPFARGWRQREPLSLMSRDTQYLLLAIATAIAQVIWMWNPSALGISALPLMALVTLFMTWSMIRLLEALAQERRIDNRTLFGATAGYLLLGISGGLLLTVLDSAIPGGFYDNFSREALTMPRMTELSGERISWELNYGRLNYFAFVSLTTLGYGDITPVVPATRLACLTLSVVGPLYIAVVLGVLISRFSSMNPAPSPAPGAALTEREQVPERSDRSPPGRSPAPEEPDREPDGSGT
jgi:voltage-gated potassium channel